MSELVLKYNSLDSYSCRLEKNNTAYLNDLSKSVPVFKKLKGKHLKLHLLVSSFLISIFKSMRFLPLI